MSRLAWSLASLPVGALAALLVPTLTGCPSGSTTVDSDAGAYADGDGAIVEGDGSVIVIIDGGVLPVSDGGPCAVLSTVPASEEPAYAKVVAQPNACSASQISGFVSSCIGGTASGSGCNAFQVDPSNSACMGCLFPAMAPNTGGVLLDSSGSNIIGANIPGCIALADPSGGPACAAAYTPLVECEWEACIDPNCRAAPQATYDACLTAAEKGACASLYMASGPCSADYADGGVGVTACATPEQVLNRICGTGM
jgi:hypothetical protein